MSNKKHSRGQRDVAYGQIKVNTLASKGYPDVESLEGGSSFGVGKP